jgi:hypothetical protein
MSAASRTPICPIREWRVGFPYGINGRKITVCCTST